MRRTWWKKGSWNVICDSCGFKFKAEQLRRRWDGLMVCSRDWEPRQPLDFIRVRGEQIALPWTRPDSDPIFLGQDYWEHEGSASVPTTGEYHIGDFVFNSSFGEFGNPGSRYIVLGWNRLTDGSQHEFGVDWDEERMFTGN